jgi:MoaA/NifB/PqqE/SkfB family radical SAM enzyme
MQYVQTLKTHEYNPWRGKTPLLGKFDMELTERCNNACIHCLINQPEHDADAQVREMDTAFVKDILRQAADLGCLAVRFTGGEPLLRNDFSELYLFARRLGIRVILFTNARLVTPELARLFSRIPPGREVEVSVYGMHSESYDAVAAARGAFSEFRRGVDLLRSHHIPFIVKYAVLPPNRHEIDEFEVFADALSYMDEKPGYSVNFDLRARRDNPLKNRLIEKLRLAPVETVTLLMRNTDYRRGMRGFCGKFMMPPGGNLFNCGAGYGVCVDAYGKAQMCMLLRHPGMVYDLYGDNAARANGGSPLQYALTEFFPRLRERRAENPEYLRRCAHCFLKGLCEQCPAKSWMEHGTLDTPVEYLCRLAHAQAHNLGLVTEKENAWEVADWQERIMRLMKDEDMHMQPTEKISRNMRQT